MNKSKLLEAIQKHGDAAFDQGYMAKTLGIDKNDRGKLAKMIEALTRFKEFQKIWDALKPNEITHFNHDADRDDAKALCKTILKLAVVKNKVS